MTKGIKIAGALCILFLCSLRLTGQVLPVPLPGGDIIQPFGLFNQFFPGVGAGFDGLNADPHGINNSRTFVAMGYTAGTATDSNGKTYNVITDIRVYQGDYIGAVPTYGAGGTTSAKAHSSRYESISTTPVRGYRCMTSIRASRPTAFSGSCKSLPTRCRSGATP